MNHLSFPRIPPKRLLITGIIVFGFVFFHTAGGHTASFCVGDASELTDALTQARSNNQDDIIKVKQGEYAGNFAYDSSEGHSITLEGGYDDVCCKREVNPENTVLDGQENGRVLLLYNREAGINER